MTTLAMPAQQATYPRNSLGVWSLVLGIASVVLALGVVTGIVRFLAGGSGS
jgi:hypothetical protein